MADVKVSRPDAGKRIRVRVGDVLEVRLPENPTTGYRWDFVAPGNLSVVSDELAAQPGGGIGAGGERVVRFRATAPGETRVEAANQRSWARGPALDTFGVDVDVSS
jgi:inhibitor of cysteine peptidase